MNAYCVARAFANTPSIVAAGMRRQPLRDVIGLIGSFVPGAIRRGHAGSLFLPREGILPSRPYADDFLAPPETLEVQFGRAGPMAYRPAEHADRRDLRFIVVVAAAPEIEAELKIPFGFHNGGRRRDRLELRFDRVQMVGDFLALAKGDGALLR